MNISVAINSFRNNLGSFFLEMINSILGAIEIPYHVIHSSEGVVGAGNYTYYKLNQPGTLRLILNPLSGDPDIYISEGMIIQTTNGGSEYYTI